MTSASSVRRVGGAIFCLVNLWATVAFATHLVDLMSIVAVLFFGYLAVAFGDFALTDSRPWPIPKRS